MSTHPFVLGIIGPAHCGSTVVSRVLSSLPGVIAPGELHWLFDTPRLDMHAPHLCFGCGASCPVFGGLSPGEPQHITRENVYDEVATLFGGADVLISSDKSIEEYQKYRRQPDLLLLLTRSTVMQAASLASHMDMPIELAAAVQTNFWLREIGLINASGICAIQLSFEVFTYWQKAAVTWLHGVTGGAIPDSTPSFPAEFHHVNGSRKAMESKRIGPHVMYRHSIALAQSLRIRKIVQPATDLLESADIPKLVKVPQ